MCHNVIVCPNVPISVKPGKAQKRQKKGGLRQKANSDSGYETKIRASSQRVIVSAGAEVSRDLSLSYSAAALEKSPGIFCSAFSALFSAGMTTVW